MSLPTSELIPDETEALPPARRRRERRHLLAWEGDGRGARLEALANRVTPSFEFFLLSFLSGLIFIAGRRLDSPALLVLGAVVNPCAGPVLGLPLAVVAGSGRFFMQTFGRVLVGALLTGLGGALGGWALRFWPGSMAQFQTQPIGFSGVDFLVLSLGVIATVITLVRSEQKTLLPGVALAYELGLPAAAVGYGLVVETPAAWSAALMVFCVYLAWGLVLGVASFWVSGFRPYTAFGYGLGAMVFTAGLGILLLSGAGSWFGWKLPAWSFDLQQIPLQQSPPSTPARLTPEGTRLPAALATASLVATSTRTLIPSSTPTITRTPAPTPVWAVVHASTNNGAFIRSEPKVGAKIITSALNGTLLQVYPDTTEVGSAIWAHVKLNDGQEGWIMQDLLETATPAPAW